MTRTQRKPEALVPLALRSGLSVLQAVGKVFRSDGSLGLSRVLDHTGPDASRDEQELDPTRSASIRASSKALGVFMKRSLLPNDRGLDAPNPQWKPPAHVACNIWARSVCLVYRTQCRGSRCAGLDVVSRFPAEAEERSPKPEARTAA